MEFIIILPFILGWLSGWLVNYLADVLPVTRKLSPPACLKCQGRFTWRDSLLFQACKKCGQRRSARTFIVQLFLTIAPVLLWLFPRENFPFWLAFIVLAYLTLVLVTDLEHRLILHPVSLFGAGLGLITGLFLRAGNFFSRGLISTLIGGAAGFGIMLVLYFLGEAYVRYMARRKGMETDEVALGFGDVNLSGVLGLMLGWPAITAGLFFAVMGGGLISLFIVVGMLITKKYKAFTAIPYAPFLIMSTIYLLYLIR
jgi:leader peptidase (prepilin peptidase)/N-methyltransferase